MTKRRLHLPGLALLDVGDRVRRRHDLWRRKNGDVTFEQR